MPDQVEKLAVRSDRAEMIAENMLVAYNSGDYQALSKDWSRPMRLVIRERAVQRFRDQNLPVTGRFTRPHSCGTGSAGQAPSCPRAVRPAPQRRAAVLVRRPVYSVLVGRAVSALRSARSAVDPAGSVLVRARGPGEDRSVRPS